MRKPENTRVGKIATKIQLKRAFLSINTCLKYSIICQFSFYNCLTMFVLLEEHNISNGMIFLAPFSLIYRNFMDTRSFHTGIKILWDHIVFYIYLLLRALEIIIRERIPENRTLAFKEIFAITSAISN